MSDKRANGPSDGTRSTTNGGVDNRPYPFPTSENHPKNPELPVPPVAQDPSEDAIDNGLEESFPASDPVSVTVTKAVPKPEAEK